MRGEADFNAARLLRELGELDFSDSYRAPAELEAYRAFYGFHSEVDHYIGRVDDGRHWVCVQALVPSPCKGTVLLCHGYYDHTGLYVHLIEHLLSRGLAVVAFDLPGHGLSSGERVVIDSFDDYVTAMHAVLEAVRGQTTFAFPEHVAAQSLGGSVVLEYLEQHKEQQFANVALLAPLVRPYGWRVVGLYFHLAKYFIRARKRTITNNADNPEFIAFQHIDPLQAHVLPVAWVKAMVRWKKRFEAYPARSQFTPKVIQGHADRTVDWRHTLKVLREHYTPQVLELENARHHLVNESAELRAQMWQWLDEACGW